MDLPMAAETETPVSHLRWQGGSLLPPPIRAALVGRGALFELVTEPVLGHPHVVFVRRPRSLRQMLDAQAAATGDMPFLISPGRQWTYREAISDIDATAVLLSQRYGVTAGDRVAFVAANQAEYAIAMWAVVTLGAIVTSLNGWWSAPELEYGIGLTSPLLIAGDERRLGRLAGRSVPAGVPVRLLDQLQQEAREFAGMNVAGTDTARADFTEDSPAVILFTSGTTGRPKGATLSHRNIINFAMVNRLAGAMAAAAAPAVVPAAGSASQRSCSIVASPMFHVSGMIAVLITGAAFPTSLVFPAPGPWDPRTWLELTAKHGVTSWSGVPTQWWRLLRHPDIDSYDLSLVRTVGSGGAVFPPELVRELHARFPQVRLGNGYGMSETVGLGTQAGGDHFVTVPESVGPAQPTVEVQVRDSGGTILPEGEIGEICLRSPSVFLGYWNDPAATQAVLDENRWYRTGDYGRVAGGLLFLESRRRDLIIRGGENIYPIEIENRLIEHPDIDEAAVIGVDHLELGQETKAFIVRRPGSRLTEQQVREWCAAALAAFKTPATVEFRESLPYTETGKLLKHELEGEERTRRARPLAPRPHRGAALDEGGRPLLGVRAREHRLLQFGVGLADLGERLEGGHAHETLRRLHAERPVGGDPAGQLQGAVQNLMRWRHRVDEAKGEGFARRDRIAGHRQLERLGQRDTACEVHAAARGEQRSLHLGQPELRVLGDHGEIAREHQLEAAGQGGRLGGADHRLIAAAGAGREAAERRKPLPLRIVGLASARREGPQVHARAERPVPGPGQDDSPDLRVAVGFKQRAADADHDREVERVARFRAVDADDEHGAPALGYDLRLNGVPSFL
jgi:acyl-CoA synthetase (AMP-forming)/AMP-acid ligase II